MMKINGNDLVLGVDLDLWNSYGVKHPITTSILPEINSHMIICGMSGSGKTFLEQIIIRNLILANEEDVSIFYFADYKGDDSFAYLRNAPRYYSYNNTLKALDEVYAILNSRLGGDLDRTPVTLIWDEYMANILSLTNVDKKLAAVTMNKVSEILLMGRSMAVRIIVSCQRPDAVAFPVGSRLNYGVVIILGNFQRSIYEMLIPDYKDHQIEGRTFNRGEGTVLLQGTQTQLHYLKVPLVRHIDKMQQLCLKALS